MLEGTLSDGDYERLIERSFDVPASTRQITIDLEYTGQSARTVLDLGLRGPAGLRGWSGGNRSHVEVSALSATAGYLPGPIEAGAWAVLLGVPNIRPGRSDRYVLTVHLRQDEERPALIVNDAPGWYAGDLHSHSMHSDGRARSTSGTSTGTPPFRVFDAAVRAGLDFVALTDHNTVSHWLEVDRLQPYFDRTLLLHGRELTTYRGHATVIGERQFNDFRLAAPDASPASLLRTIAADGAFISINHPTSPDDETCMGCGWNVTDADVMQSVQGVEIVNGDLRGPESLRGWTFWAELLNRGFHVTAVGGSDEHTVDDPQDRRIGVPSTVVRAASLSEPAVIAGLRAGHVYVRVDGPDGPRLEFAAESRGVHYDMGDTIADADTGGPLSLRATVSAADGQTLEWIKNGIVFASDVLSNRQAARDVESRPGDWFSLRTRSGDRYTSFSNAVYVGRRP